MKISIITVAYNSAATIADTLTSVAQQDYSDIEHIIIDGASKDNTLEIVGQFSHVAKVISEPDQGIYDAMNKGIRAATGEVIGFLNSDDFFSNNNVISTIVHTLKQEQCDSVFADIKFVLPDNINKIVRYYSSKKFHPDLFVWGYMPAHPTFYTYRRFYEQYGVFKINYKISADYEILIRFLKVYGLSYQYIPLDMVTMRSGGISNTSLKSRLTLNQEIVRACRENGLKTNPVKIGLKIFSKLSELIFISRHASH